MCVPLCTNDGRGYVLGGLLLRGLSKCVVLSGSGSGGVGSNVRWASSGSFVKELLSLTGFRGSL